MLAYAGIAEPGDTLVRHQLVVGLWRDDVLVRPLKVGLNTSWRLCGHLKTTLQDRLWEVIDWHRCQDKPEVFMHFLVLYEL